MGDLSDDEAHGLLALQRQGGMAPRPRVMQSLRDKGLVSGFSLTPAGVRALANHGRK